METIKRKLKLDLPKKQSAFLWGIRKTGKSSFLKEQFPDSYYIDLLDNGLFFRYSKEPWKFREEILSLDKKLLKKPVIVDEVQKVPEILDEIHWLIENSEASFILCGSSARKLKRGAANLLGGRAWRYHMYPFSFIELEHFDLLKAFNQGLLPQHYLSKNPKKFLKAYIQDYLKEEIQAESLVRKLPNFSRFLDSFVFSNGEMTNYSNIARDCGISSNTVKEYYQILVDTLMGYYIYPFFHRESRDSIKSTPKFYLADLGIVSELSKRSINILKGSEAGKAFEHFVFLELIAYRGTEDKEYEIKYWRTKTGKEVDFVITLGRNLIAAIEIKISDSVHKQELSGLIEFMERNPRVKAIVVSLDPRKRLMKTEYGDIEIYPYKEFLKNLWEGDLL
jgi:uncharacterized protein